MSVQKRVYKMISDRREGMFKRECLTIEEERTVVSELFDNLESKGFKKSFYTPYMGEQDMIGEKFTVIERVDESEHNIMALPMWKIKFSNGRRINAFPEEIIEGV